jgi:hypothetical protein
LSARVHFNRFASSRARGKAAATLAIELLDLREPAVWGCAAGQRRRVDAVLSL